jgi:hypothetical protein
MPEHSLTTGGLRRLQDQGRIMITIPPLAPVIARDQST